MTERIANEASSTLASPINASTLTLTVASAASFPNSGDFRVRVDDEFLLVTGVSGSTFTVSRGVEGSTAAVHAAGAAVTHVLTAAGLEAYILSVQSVDGGATELYVQEDAPTGVDADPWQWWELNPDQTLKTLWVNVP